MRAARSQGLILTPYALAALQHPAAAQRCLTQLRHSWCSSCSADGYTMPSQRELAAVTPSSAGATSRRSYAALEWCRRLFVSYLCGYNPQILAAAKAAPLAPVLRNTPRRAITTQP